jgi:hypothetical protein
MRAARKPVLNPADARPLASETFASGQNIAEVISNHRRHRDSANGRSEGFGRRANAAT